MKVITKGGKIINRGYTGIVMELFNNDDDNTLYNDLKKTKPKDLTLITIDERIKIPIKDLDSVLRLIRLNSKTTLAKKFSYIIPLFNTDEKRFNNELEGYKQLISMFGKDISKYTTVKRGFEYNKKDIYGILFNKTYYIFIEKCYKTIDNIKFTQKSLNKCVNDITEVLDILKKNNYIHNDIKPDNIIYCNKRFKLIDWESSNLIKNQTSTFINSKNGNFTFNHPIKFYKIGLPYFFYRYIYDAEIQTYPYIAELKSPVIITEMVYNSFNDVLKRYKNSSKDYYLKLADYYSFAISIIYMAEKNNIDYPKKFVNDILANYFIKNDIRIN
jgi:serine/threonine protein kinase